MARLIVEDSRIRPGVALLEPTEVDIADEALAAGAFGAIHQVRLVNSQVADQPLIAKIFRAEDQRGIHCAHTLRRLFDKIDADIGRRENDSRFFDTEFCALPLCLVDAIRDQSLVRAFLAFDVTALGYLSINSPQDIGLRERALRSLSIDASVELCASLIKTVATLHQVGFIHADLNPQNLAINLSDRRTALLDFDGGAVVDGVDEFPQSGGKQPPWVSPEVYNAMQEGKRPIGFEQCQQAELWCLALLIAWLLFGESPTLRENKESGGFNCDLPWIDPDFSYKPKNGEIEARAGRRLEAALGNTAASQLLALMRRTLLPGGASFGGRPLPATWMEAVGLDRPRVVADPPPTSRNPQDPSNLQSAAESILESPSRSPWLVVAPITAFSLLSIGLVQLHSHASVDSASVESLAIPSTLFPDLSIGRYGGVVSWNGLSESLTIWIRGVIETLPDGRGTLVEFDLVRSGRFYKGGKALFYRGAGALLLDDGAIFSLTRDEDGMLQLRGVRKASGVLELEEYSEL